MQGKSLESKYGSPHVNYALFCNQGATIVKDVVSDCPIDAVMRVLSGRWPTLLLYYLKDGSKRFSDLRRDNPTVSHRMLAQELRKLEEAGIVRRTERQGYPTRVDYELTAAGSRLVPHVDALSDWWEESRVERAGHSVPSRVA
jgi:DNA-binding HxlR family transcriptional regulator